MSGYREVVWRIKQGAAEADLNRDQQAVRTYPSPLTNQKTGVEEGAGVGEGVEAEDEETVMAITSIVEMVMRRGVMEVLVVEDLAEAEEVKVTRMDLRVGKVLKVFLELQDQLVSAVEDRGKSS